MTKRKPERVRVIVSIDTEEDNWGSWDVRGATVRNIQHLVELQECFDRWGARPTYLVNRPPLVEERSVATLRELVARENVEIGAHCHPWNTPPYTGRGSENSMMCDLLVEENQAKIHNVVELIGSELGARVRSFRAGRWGFGSTVASALMEEGITIDCSVSPFIDWTGAGGPDFTDAQLEPYRFDPAAPLQPVADGRMVEIPTTIGFLRGDHRRLSRFRSRLVRSTVAKLKVVGMLDISGLVTRRWLSPEQSSLDEMIELSNAIVEAGGRCLQMTFHSCTLLPGATPFVRDERQRAEFLSAIEGYLQFCQESGFVFSTVAEQADQLTDAEVDSTASRGAD